MDNKNRFYLLWTAAILLCTALAVFLLLHASFTSPEADTAPVRQSQSQEY